MSVWVFVCLVRFAVLAVRHVSFVAILATRSTPLANRLCSRAAPPCCGLELVCCWQRTALDRASMVEAAEGWPGGSPSIHQGCHGDF